MKWRPFSLAFLLGVMLAIINLQFMLHMAAQKNPAAVLLGLLAFLGTVFSLVYTTANEFGVEGHDFVAGSTICEYRPPTPVSSGWTAGFAACNLLYVMGLGVLSLFS